MAAEASKSEEKNEVEINTSEISSRVKRNPWIVSSVILLIALIVVVLFVRNGSITGNVIAEDKIGQSVLSFINANPELGGSAELVKTEREGMMYKVTISYQGKEIPVYVTLDGKYLAANMVPLDVGSGLGSELEAEPEIVDVSVDDDPVLGDPNAPVTIIEFSDYQCPFCRKFWTDVYPQLKKEYIDTGKVKLVYRDYPLDSHPMALSAAIAAQCTKPYGAKAYWRMHDKIFSEQNIIDSGVAAGPVKSTVNFTDEDLIHWAMTLGYKIQPCLITQKYAAEVLADKKDGDAVGIDGTPAFFIDGEKLVGAVPFEQFKEIIDQHLSEVGVQ